MTKWIQKIVGFLLKSVTPIQRTNLTYITREFIKF
jgi:hypothetical protein